MLTSPVTTQDLIITIFSIALGLPLGLLILSLLWPSPIYTPRDNFLYFWGRLYSRLFQRLKITGRHNLPTQGGVLIVANHTAGVDPVLVSAHLPRFVRWIMAKDMRLPTLEWFWRWQRIIFVGRDTGEDQAPNQSPDQRPEPDSTRATNNPKEDTQKPDRAGLGIREALTELKEGGVVGIFPEGGIERPPNHIMPFQSGVGLIVRRAKVPVVPVWISGTPQVDPAWASLWTRGRARIVIGEPIDYTTKKLSAKEIADDLRQTLVNMSGWPENDHPQHTLEQARHNTQPAPDKQPD